MLAWLGLAAAYAPPDTFGGQSVVPANMKHLFEPVNGKDSCKAVPGQVEADDAWCAHNCEMAPPNCPKNLCNCQGGNPDMSPQTPAENEARRVFAQREAEVIQNDKKNKEYEMQRKKEELVKDQQDAERVKRNNDRVEEQNQRVEQIDQAIKQADRERQKLEQEGKLLNPRPSPNGRYDARYDDRKRIEDLNERVREENERVKQLDREREEREEQTRQREHELRVRAANRPKPSPRAISTTRGDSALSLPGADAAKCKSFDRTDAGDKWCLTSCSNEPPMCPASMCTCTAGATEPSPQPLAPDAAEARPMTPVEAAAAKRVEERNAAIAKADADRKEAEAKRKADEAKRAADEAKRAEEADERRKALDEQAKAARDRVSNGTHAEVEPSPRPVPAIKALKDWLFRRSLPSPSPFASPSPSPSPQPRAGF